MHLFYKSSNAHNHNKNKQWQKESGCPWPIVCVFAANNPAAHNGCDTEWQWLSVPFTSITGITHLYTHLTTTHNRVWHHLMQPAVSYEWYIYLFFLNRGKWRLHLWNICEETLLGLAGNLDVHRVGVISSWSGHCEMVLLCPHGCFCGLPLCFFCNARTEAK